MQSLMQFDPRYTIYTQVSKLHCNAINNGFLSTLGEDVLSLVYESIDADPYSILIVEIQDNKVIGFVSGGNGLKSVYKQLIYRFPRLIVALLPSLTNPTKLRKVCELIFFGSNPELIDIPTTELYSIAVLPFNRRSGVSARLYEKLCDHFRAKGNDSFRIVVGDSLASAHSFYNRMGAVPLQKIELHKGQTSTVYKQVI